MSSVSPAGSVKVHETTEVPAPAVLPVQRVVVEYATTVEFGSIKSARPSPSVSTHTSGSKSKSSLVSRYPSLSSSVSIASHMLTAVVWPPVPG